MNNKGRQLGPVIGATLVTTDLELVIKGYSQCLSFTLVYQGKIDKQQALAWQTPRLENNRYAILASSDQTPWLRVIEDKDAKKVKPLHHYGWMSLETNVGDVDSLRQTIKSPYFQVIGEPAYLQVSDAIKAMQVIGPASEVSYLTQVERPVPLFELPITNDISSGLFIPVLMSANRSTSLEFYQSLNNADSGLSFETKITVLNNAHGKDIEHQYPVSTLQFAGNCLIEIDQVETALPIADNQGGLPSGIALVSIYTSALTVLATQHQSSVYQLDSPYYQGVHACLIKGPSGELIELIGSI